MTGRPGAIRRGILGAWLAMGLAGGADAGAPARSAEPPVAGANPPAADAAQAAATFTRRAAELVAAVGEYRTTLESLLAIHEHTLARAVARHQGWQDLLARGVISRREFEESAGAVAAAQRQVDETRSQIDAADHAAAEASTLEAVAALPPIAPGDQQQTPLLSRYRGPTVWALAPGTAALRQMFAARFGRGLPVSAFGQSPLHDRMGLDHRNALDVAVFPDSPEGRALIEYLRAEGIPFIAYRGPVPGAATGAHIHVGQPSARITVQR